jgi:PelA/Pel-15E family pectate lyase
MGDLPGLSGLGADPGPRHLRMTATLKALIALLLVFGSCAPAVAQSRAEIERTMKRATSFMVDKAATNGGYVWSYLPDFSRRWGEIEAQPSMIWVQPPGTATMGHLFLDAFHATGDDYYYHAAELAAGALIRGQHRSGGWNYLIDFAGPPSEKHWYETVGRNAWRMEEFQHHADNATFDDAGTSESMQFLLRLYLEKQDPRYLPPLDKAIRFVLDSQYPIGGWPQRWPPDPKFPRYSEYITFNDDVAAENIKFLMMAYRHLGRADLLDAIERGMNAFLVAQQGKLQPGWALQYTLDLRPAAARSYEPLALATHTTASNIRALLDFYRMTGDATFIARIPEAIAWLESVRVPAGQERNGRAFPTFIEIGTDRPIFVHRRGSNVINGEYYSDYDSEATLGHYSAFRAIDTADLKREYDELRAIPPAELRKASPLHSPDPLPIPRYVVTGDNNGSDLNASAGSTAAQVIRTLNKEGWWPTPLRATSNPYAGDGPATATPGDYRSTHVGDATDTSPYPTDKPVIGISTATYLANMALLIRALTASRRR